MAYEFTTLPTAGALTGADYSILYQGGVPKKLFVQTSARGTIPTKTLSVTLTGGFYIHVADPANDIGWLMLSKGIDNNFVQINPQSVAAWDYSQGSPFFLLGRVSNAACSLQTGANECAFTASISGTTLTVSAVSSGGLAVNQVINFDTNSLVLPRTRIASQLGGTTGGVGTYSLTVAGAATTQTVVSTAMTTGVIIYNNDSIQLKQNGANIMVGSTESNVWIVS